MAGSSSCLVTALFKMCISMPVEKWDSKLFQNRILSLGNSVLSLSQTEFNFENQRVKNCSPFLNP